MHSTIAFGFLASLGLLASAHPFPAKVAKRGTCQFDAMNPLVRARDASIKRQSSALDLGSTRPSDLTTPLDEVWEHTEETRPADLDFENYGYDQIIAGEGKINYCVRWESSNTLTQANRASIETAVQRSFKKWVDVLAGYDGFPYSSVDVNVVGYAVSDESLLEGSTDGVDVYTDTDGEGAPQCAEECGRFFHYQDGDYSGCAGGKERHYDMSLWLTDGFEGGAGGDWGQRMGSDYFLESVEQEDIHIHLHELGHTFGLDDFYDWTPTGTDGAFIMKAGGAMSITEFDAWMARDWWTKAIKSRYPNSGSSGSADSAGSEVAEPASTAPTSEFYSSAAAPATSFPAPMPSEVPTLTSVAGAQPTGYFPGGNSTVAPSGSGIYPTGSGFPMPTGSPVPMPTVSAVALPDNGGAATPCPEDEETPEVTAAANNNYNPWGRGRWGKVRAAAKHEWRD